MSDENVTITENTSVSRDPVTGEAVQTIERTIARTDNSSWGLWVAGIAVFGAVLVIALFLIGRNNQSTDDQVLAAQAQADAARAQADQATQEAANARLDATATALNAGNSAANDAALRSAAAAEAAANRASAAADAAASRPAPVIVQSPPADASGGADELPPGQ